MFIIKSATVLLMLLNPFLVILYLIDVVKKKNKLSFSKSLIKAGILSTIVFAVFAMLGDVIFTDIIGVEFASFQIFGGIIFLIIGIQFVLNGTTAIESLRGDSEDVYSAIAMPIMIGPGTISASIIIGKTLAPVTAILTIAGTVFVSVGVMILLKFLHDWIIPRKEALIQKYIETAGRILSLYIGTVSINMIIKGLKVWLRIIFPES